MANHTANRNSLWAYLALEELARCGVSHICISPGSRSTPLTVAAAENAAFHTEICLDERGAAYHALGYARATGRPAALICTSGTAVANYLPAVVEASEDQIPLIICSSDRPPELRATSANQTTDQVKIFGDFVRFFVDMPCPDPDINQRMVLTTMDLAVSKAIGANPGPVHLNFMFREPFWPTDQSVPNMLPAELQTWYKSKDPFTRRSMVQQSSAKESIKNVAEIISDTRSGLVLIGRYPHRSAKEPIRQFIDKLNWPVFTDVASELRSSASANLLTGLDLLLLSEDVPKKYHPDTVIHFGSELTSKRMAKFIETVKPANYVRIINTDCRADTFHRATLHVHTDAAEFCKALDPKIENWPLSTELAALAEADEMINRVTEEFINTHPGATEIAVPLVLDQKVNASRGLFLANSMPVRDMDMFFRANHPFVAVEGNRGVSGIDGTLASAIGFSYGLQLPVTLVCGDLALLHDMNSFAQLSSLPYPMIILLVNNGGGGIFSFLPIASKKSVFEKYFETPQNVDFKHVANAFGVRLIEAKSRDELVSAYAESLSGKQHCIIEISSDREQNYRFHTELYEIIADSIKNLMDNENNAI